MDGVAEDSEVNVASIFRVEICRIDEFLCIYKFMFRKTKMGRERVGISCYL
jgi:hypothetical protein